MASDGEISCTTDPNFAVIYSFLKVFGKLYGLEIPTITKLQEFVENTQEVLNPLKELHLRLLRRALKSVPSDRWERSLIKFCHQHGHHQEAWEMERFSYKKASTSVKLKVLKFTCHPKFKLAVNAITCKELRLDPIGRDKNGCVYWLQVDHEANLCLYKEDQDEETWQLIARNREELVKVISQLKNGEEISPSEVTNANEDSNSTDLPIQNGTNKPVANEENDEEFLSPESETDHEHEINQKSTEEIESNEKTNDDSSANHDEQVKSNKNTEVDDKDSNVNNNTDQETHDIEDNIDEPKSVTAESDSVEDNVNVGNATETSQSLPEHKEGSPEAIKGVETQPECDETTDVSINEPVEDTSLIDKPKSPQEKDDSQETSTTSTDNVKPDTSDEKENLELVEEKEKPEVSKEESKHFKSPVTKATQEEQNDNVIGEEISEPVMVVTGDGNGADCESYFIGEEIEEEVMFFYGEGNGYDNDTGNTEVLHQEEEKDAQEENGEECVNGDNHSSKPKSVKNIKLKGKSASVTKRSLKKQSTDNSEALKPDTKKHCVRNLDKSDSCNSTSTPEKELRSRRNDKTPESDSPAKNNARQGRNKVKKNLAVGRRLNIKQKLSKESAEKDPVKDSKTSIIEKRKSSLSSEDQEDEQEKEPTPDTSPKLEETLPPKKLRLHTTEGDSSISHSNNVNTVDNVNSDKIKQNDVDESNVSISQRKKIKAIKGKYKRKSVQNKTPKKEVDKEGESGEENKVKNKSLKRSLMDATVSDRSKSESHTESENDEPVTRGKRQKIKPKKIVKSSRRKVEAKLQQKHSSEESEEETLYSLGKKCAKKAVKKKVKVSKDKESAKKSVTKAESGSDTPVRQSRRIAQLKIKEEADRRHLEEVALRELKMIHKKRDKKEDEDWHHSGSSRSSSWSRNKTRKSNTWKPQDSSGNDPSESDEPLFEHHYHEPDLNFTKSDHEFSPESDLETDEPGEPLKRARTLQEEKDSGFCQACGSAEQPEWILLCDRCDEGYHASCLKPILFLVPAGDWFCPPCSHIMLIESLEKELVKYDELLVVVEEEKAKRKQEAFEKQTEDDKDGKEGKDDHKSGEESSDYTSSSSEEEAVYRLRARRQLPVSYRAQEYDRLISSAIKEEYVEPTTSAGNQGRGKDISTIIEAAEEEKMKAEREAADQGKPIEKKVRKKQRKKPRKLNSLDVPSEDDDEIDEDFKDTGMESSSEEISSSAERGSSAHSGSSDDLPIRRACRTEKKDRPKLVESSPEVKKKKKGVFTDSSSESGEKEWNKKKKSKHRPTSSKKREKREKCKHRNRLTQYDAEGNVVRPRVTYGGLSDEPNDWSPKHRTRQKKINYTEMPNTESEDEMHKSSGKHMMDSSDEFKVDDSDFTDDSESEKLRKKRDAEQDEEKRKALDDLITKTAVVPLEKLPEDVTKAKTEELHAHLEAQALAQEARPSRGRGSRGPRGNRGGGRGRGRGGSRPSDSDDALARLVGVKIKDFNPDGTPKPLNPEREKKKQEREAKLAEKEARKMERLQKKEEKEKMKEMKAKEREEKKQAKLALQESKRIKKEKPEFNMMGPNPGPNPGFGPRPDMRVNMFGGSVRQNDFPEQGFPAAPRLQVRAELRGVLTGDVVRPEHHQMREGTLSVAGSPQPFKPVSEEPSIITRMPHMLNQQYRGSMMYQSGNGPYGGRGPQGMYQMHPGLGPRPHYSQFYPHMRQYSPHQPQPQPGQRPPPPHPGMPPHQRLPPHPGQALPPGHPGQAMQPGHLGQSLPPGHPGQALPPGHPAGQSLPPGHLGHPGHPGRPPHPGLRHPGLPSPHPSHMRDPAQGSPSPALLRAILPQRFQRPPYPEPDTKEHKEPSTDTDPVQIKTEVKTEQPEYQSPPASPDPPRPKIKHTPTDKIRPRFPLGPYAPHYAAYGPYAPPPHLGPQHPPPSNGSPHHMLPHPPQYAPPHPSPHPPQHAPSHPPHHMSPHPQQHASPHPTQRASPHPQQNAPHQPQYASPHHASPHQPSHPPQRASPHPPQHAQQHAPPHSPRSQSPHAPQNVSPHPPQHAPTHALPHPPTHALPHPPQNAPSQHAAPHPPQRESPHPPQNVSPHPPPHLQQHAPPHPLQQRPLHPPPHPSQHLPQRASPHPPQYASPHPPQHASPHPPQRASPNPPHPQQHALPHPPHHAAPQAPHIPPPSSLPPHLAHTPLHHMQHLLAHSDPPRYPYPFPHYPRRETHPQPHPRPPKPPSPEREPEPEHKPTDKPQSPPPQPPDTNSNDTPPPSVKQTEPQESQAESPKPEPVRVKEEIKTEPPPEPPGDPPEPPREEGSVFGGLVSYFSSQQDDIDT